MKIPPPPVVVKPKPIPPPPIVVAQGSALGASYLGTANAHVRRVTLNLIRLSTVCPDQLRPTLDILANAAGWDMDKLERKHVETIYAFVDDALADAAKAEFSANTSTIVDHRTEDAECKLCGHKHIRWEFQLENSAGGQDVWTGSTCIIEYGLNVDGSATAEEALARLNEAINKAKRRAAKEDWQLAHPDHKKEMARCFAASTAPFPFMSRPLWQFVGSDFSGRWKRMQKWGMAAVRYYDREGFLTGKRTRQVYGENEGVLAMHTKLFAEYEQAQITIATRHKFWIDAQDKYGSADPEAKAVFSRAEYMLIACNEVEEAVATGYRATVAKETFALLSRLKMGIPAPPSTKPKKDLPF